MQNETGSGNENSSTFLQSSHAMDESYYNWCTDYPITVRIWSAISMIFFLLGLPVSVWVLHDLLQRQRQKSTSDFIMFILAVMNMAFIVHIPFCVGNFLFWHIKELQIILIFINNTCINGRPLFMACICWDCYVAVVHPIVYKTSNKHTVIKKAITIATCFTIMSLGLINCYKTWLFTTPFVGIPLIVALPVIAFCDISILVTLRKPDPTGKIKIHPQKKQALQTIFNSFIMTFVIYLPPMIIFVFGKLMTLGETELYCCIVRCGLSFLTAGCIIMPVLYLVSVGKLDRLKTFCKKSTLICNHKK